MTKKEKIAKKFMEILEMMFPEEECEAQEKAKEWPKENNLYWLITQTGRCATFHYKPSERPNADTELLKFGNCWKTQEHAEEVKEAVKKLFSEYRNKFGY